MHDWIVHSITELSALFTILVLLRACLQLSMISMIGYTSGLITYHLTDVLWVKWKVGPEWISQSLDWFQQCISWDYSVPVAPLKIPSPHSQQEAIRPDPGSATPCSISLKWNAYSTVQSQRSYITLTFDLQAWTAVCWRAVLRFLYPSICPGLTAVCRPLCILCGFVLPSFIGHWETVTSFCSPTLLAFCSSASLWLWLDCSVLCSVEVALISLWASCKKRKVISFILQTQLSPLW